MAEELGLEPAPAKRLVMVGSDHEVEESHAVVVQILLIAMVSVLRLRH